MLSPQRIEPAESLRQDRAVGLDAVPVARLEAVSGVVGGKERLLRPVVGVEDERRHLLVPGGSVELASQPPGHLRSARERELLDPALTIEAGRRLPLPRGPEEEARPQLGDPGAEAMAIVRELDVGALLPDVPVGSHEAEELGHLGRHARPRRSRRYRCRQRQVVARRQGLRPRLASVAMQHGVVGGHRHDTAARLHRQQAMLGIPRPMAARRDGAYPGPPGAVPHLEPLGREELDARALLPHRHEVRWRAHRDPTRVANHEGCRGDNAFVVEQYPRARVEPVALAIVDRDEVAVHLGHAVRAARVKGGRLALRRLAHPAEHLARAGLVEARLGGDQANGLEEPGDAHGVELRRQHGLLPGGGDEGLRGEVVDLVRLDRAQEVDERELVEQVRLSQLDAVAQVCHPLEVLRARAAHHTDDAVALLE